jgi:hypothetical protein
MKVPIGLQVRAIAVLMLVRVLLKRTGTTGTLRRLARPGFGKDVDPQIATRAVRRAGRLVGGVCLPQCVALAALLQRAGREPTLVLGCRRGAGGNWTAHAWIEVGNDVHEPVPGGRNTALAQLRWADGWSPSAVPQEQL